LLKYHWIEEAQHAKLDGLVLKSLGRAIGRTLSEDEHRQFLDVQHQALRWTFLGSAMENRNFLAVLAGVSDEGAARAEQAAKTSHGVTVELIVHVAMLGRAS
jgi:hypothetical protein